MAVSDSLEGLNDQVAALTQGLAGAERNTAALNSGLTQMQSNMVYTGREVDALSVRIGRSLGRAFDDVVFGGESLSKALNSVAERMSTAAYSVAMRPVENAVGGTIATGLNTALSAMFPFADGGAFSQGRVMPFAKGGVVSAPTTFPMRGATGLMGEAGPEAIMPLTRGADGRLGVQSAGGGRAVNVVMNVTTPDTAGFARSQNQIAQQINRALSRGNRNA